MIECNHLEFEYPGETFRLRLNALSVEAEESLAVVGHSGCGKSTLLRLIAGILSPAKGTVTVDGRDVGRLPAAERQRFRITRIGLVFQEFELIEYLTIHENILLPFRISDGLTLDRESEERAEALLDSVGLADLGDRVPEDCSQGERQRAALCRALVTQPALILADEPTGSLDPDNQARSVDLLLESASAAAATLLMVTHNHEILSGFDRVVDLPDIIH